MTHVNDDKLSALGGTSLDNTNDLEIIWLQSKGATSDNINDAWMELYVIDGATADNINDAALEWLLIQGYTGDNLADGWAWYWFSASATAANVSPGWTQTSSFPHNYQFDVPPGANFASLTFTNLVIGKNYSIQFDASGDLIAGTLVFRPGDFAEDTEILVGSYDFTFLADNQNGTTRFAVQDITSVTQFKIDNVRIEES